MIQKKEDEIKQLKKRAKLQLRNLEVDCVKAVPLGSDPQFKLLSKYQTNPLSTIYKVGEAVANAQKSVMCLTDFEIFSKMKYMDESIWKKAVKRGVKFKFIIGECAKKELELNLDPVLKNNDYFKVELFSNDQPTCIILIDDREVFCRMGTTMESPVLWSNSHNFVAMIKDYFKMKWKLLNNSRK